jgi:tRNA threonylcarbamoyladenosine biosynthesis protein TsaE
MKKIVYNLEEIEKVTNELINLTVNNKVIAFEGLMGAGKTTLIKSICEKLGVKDVINSPTFSIINEYQSPDYGLIYHFDFYRIKNISEAQDIGVEDYFYSGCLCLLEWAEKIKDILPENTLFIHIEELPDGSRSITF